MDMRVIITVVSFIVFLLIVLWAYSGRQKTRFDEAANLPFADDDMQQRTVEQRQSADDKVSSDKKFAGQSAVRATAEQEVPHG
jgi:cytochrome c oxidase cbb3-type subunit 4